MNVWFGTNRDMTEPDLTSPSLFKYRQVQASHTWKRDTVDAIRMPQEPKSSGDRDLKRWTSWPEKGQEQWVEVDLGEEIFLERISVFWYDDNGGVQTPASWHLETKVTPDQPWEKLEIYNTDSFSTLKDSYNAVQPAEKTKARFVRVVIKAKNESAVGILALNIY